MWGPRLRGQVVLMRPIAEPEIPVTMEWFADPDVLRYLGEGLSAVSPVGEREWWEKAGTNPDAFHWGLEFEGRLVGQTSITHVDWVNRNAMTGTVIGDRSAWGHGVATEAMRLRSEFAFRQLQLHKLSSGWYEPNVASGKAQKAAGFSVIGRSRDDLYRDGRWYDQILTELLRADWEAAR